MADHRVALLGAPDASLADPQAKSRCVQAMQLNLTSDVVEELLDCIRSGKRPQVLFGSAPVCTSRKQYPGSEQVADNSASDVAVQRQISRPRNHF